MNKKGQFNTPFDKYKNPKICDIDALRLASEALRKADILCGEIYELKSKRGNIGKKIADGAYSTMIERITSDSNPDLFLLQYNEQYDITDLMLVPRFFFVLEIIEKRKPLA